MSATILIVGFRAYDDLERCLTSLAHHEPDTPVVVVDHAADEPRGRALAERFPAVRYEPRPGNPGFAAGVNDAARHAGPGPLLLLNPDCEIAAPIVRPLADALDTYPQAAVIGGIVREADGSVQASARRFPGLTTGLGGRTSWLSRVAPGNPLTRRNLTTDPTGGVTQVDWVSGALMMVRRQVFDALGGFDERFFLYWEDADFCRRAREVGWATLYAPFASATHFTGRTSLHAPLRSLWAFHRSALRYHWKHGSVWTRLATPLVAIALLGRFLVRAVGALRRMPTTARFVR